MKKAAILAIVLLIVSMIAVPVFAAQSAHMSVYASTGAVKHGDTFTVTVSTSAVEHCVTGGFMFSYDTAAFEFVSGYALVSGFSAAGVSTEGGNVAGYFMNGDATVQGEIFQITLRVKDGAAYGSYTISGTPSLTTQIENVKESVPCSAGSAAITVTCDHNYSGWSDLNDGTSHGKTCSICHDVLKEDHIWNVVSVITPASCSAEGEAAYACTVCNATKTDVLEKLPHTYDHSCDADCNVCGASRTTSHNYSATWSRDYTGHWYECTGCKDRKDAAPHSPGPAATEYDPQICTICGYIIQQPLGHKHSYANQWTTDETGHWYTCTGCDERGSYADHDFENDCDADCAICGYTREIEHTPDENWSTDKNGHWRICTVCGQNQDESAHEPGAETTATTPQTCSICGFVITPAASETDPVPTDPQATEPVAPVPDDLESQKTIILTGVVTTIAVAAVGFVTLVIAKSKKKD